MTELEVAQTAVRIQAEGGEVAMRAIDIAWLMSTSRLSIPVRQALCAMDETGLRHLIDTINAEERTFAGDTTWQWLIAKYEPSTDES